MHKRYVPAYAAGFTDKEAENSKCCFIHRSFINNESISLTMSVSSTYFEISTSLLNVDAMGRMHWNVP